MQNFNFYNPTNIVFGRGEMSKLDTLVPKDARVLITYGGGSVKRFGTLDKVVEELSNSSERKVFEFGGIEPNPQFPTLMKAVEIVREQKIDFLLAVGGGSVMDGTKFIAIASNTKEFVGREADILKCGFAGVPTTREEVLPLGTVVTLPATGSEMNSGGVISNGEDKLFVGTGFTFPVFSILDPELTFTLPENQVANGVVDTFIHVMEQYLTYPVDARFQDRTAEGILQTLVEIGRETIDNPTDYDTRSNLVWCATMALNGLIGAGVPQDWSTHMLGHEITALFGLAHARTLAIILPANLSVMIEDKKDKLVQYGERVWNIREGSNDEKAKKAIEKTEEFFRSLGMKTRLSENDIEEKDFDKILANFEKHGMNGIGENGKVSLDITRDILKKAL